MLKSPSWVILTVAAICLAIHLRAPAAEEKPLSEQDLTSLVELGIDESAIVAKIQKSGLAFTADDAAIERLKKAGAADKVLKAVRDTAAKKQPSSPGAITYQDVLKLVTLGLDEDAIIARLSKSPTVFTLDAAQVDELKKAGASDKLLAALAGNRPQVGSKGDVTDFAIVLDCSGSMLETTKDRQPKMVVAKRVVADLVKRVPDGLRLTFVVYGHDKKLECQAVKVVRELSVIDASGKLDLVSTIGSLQPAGSTPIALALRTAGRELTKNDANCGLVLISDGKETCQGDPAAEAAALAANPKLTFGVQVVGFDVTADERGSLEAIATAGRGKYFNAETSAQLAESMSTIAKNLESAAKPAPRVTSGRRAVKLLSPAVKFPVLKEILLAPAGKESNIVYASVTARTTKFDDEIRVPSGTEKYDIWWVPQEGMPVRMVKEFTAPERRVFEIRPEEHLGLIQVNGSGLLKQILIVPPGTAANVRGAYAVQRGKKYGDVLVVPAGKYDVATNDDLIEEGLEVEAGKLYELQ